MACVTDGAAADSSDAGYRPAASAVIAALAGVLLAWTADASALGLLVAIACVQAVFAFSWVFGLRLPGRIGALVIAAMTAATADTTVSVWPQGRLSPLLAVFALAMPVLFVHQLMRGAARVRVLASLGSVAVLVVAEVSLPAWLQLRHEFGAHGAQVASGMLVAAAGALVAGFLVDLALPVPRFDVDVPRGLLAVIASTAVGAGLGQLTVANSADFPGGRALFVGAALGAIVALFAVAVAFSVYDVDRDTAASVQPLAGRLRLLVGVLLPLGLLGPVAFVLCTAVRT
jgi:hypothetical protein